MVNEIIFKMLISKDVSMFTK